MQKFNIWSFVLSIICVVLFFIVSFSGVFNNYVMGIHPLNLVLYITLITLMLGVLGFGGIQDWKGMARSVTTMILTLGLSLFLSFVLFFGNLIS
ncbi:MAG: hypothetical protein LPK00_11770 [Bacillaceae bacterium]|nr:hypothetical protein [Bacillaceae bacterium]